MHSRVLLWCVSKMSELMPCADKDLQTETRLDVFECALWSQWHVRLFGQASGWRAQRVCRMLGCFICLDNRVADPVTPGAIRAQHSDKDAIRVHTDGRTVASP